MNFESNSSWASSLEFSSFTPLTMISAHSDSQKFYPRISCWGWLLFQLVWQTGIVYAVEFSHRSGRDLVNMAKKRTNVIPIIEDARHPAKYRMLVGMVDVIFSDVAQPDQVLVVSYASIYFESWKPFIFIAMG